MISLNYIKRLFLSIVFYIKGLTQMSLKEGMNIGIKSLKRIREVTPKIPYDEFVQMDTFKYIYRENGKIIKKGKSNKIIFPSPAYKPRLLTFVLRRKTTDFHVFNEIFCSGEYNEIRNLIRQKNLGRPIVIVDAGANIGCTSLWLSEIFRKSKIYAIEADYSNYCRLKENVFLNKRENQIIPIHNAFWYKDEELNLSADFGDGREYACSVLPELKSSYEKVQGIGIKTLRARFHITEIDFLKIDIEGAEKYLFENIDVASEILENVYVLGMEIHDDVADRAMIVSNFEKLNYKWFVNNDTFFAYKRLV